MQKLEPPHSHHLSAALGWLKLENPAEALVELDRLPQELRRCAEALFVQWEIEAKQKNWEASLNTARELIAIARDEPDGWIKQSYSLHELKRTREAWEALVAVESRFPKVSIIPYNLACYACQIGNHAEAMERLARAIRIGGKGQIKKMASNDVDLKLLWEEIGKL